MKCRFCGKEVVHYWISGKPYCDVNCEKKKEKDDVVENLKTIFNIK